MLSNPIKNFRARFPRLVRLIRILRGQRWPKGSIVYYTGNRKGGLTPLNLEKGTSGTDSAVIHLTREWAKAGRDVTVYSNCSEHEGDFDGVKYINQYRFNPHDRFDTLIILAHPYLLRFPVLARKVVWDWHDVLGNTGCYPPDKIARFDHIFAKSHFQRNLLPDIADEYFTVVTNGIDQTFLELPETPRNLFKLIYASRYYRGLEPMLEYGWPVIKSKIPEAELHVYHGWVRRELHPKHAEWRKKMDALFQQDGVIEHGRVSQKKLIAEKASASIHYYACTYPEIDCISVRESAAVGCVPVTTDFAVFQEKEYCVRVAGDPNTQETQEAVAQKIVELLLDSEKLNQIRQQFRDRVKTETWQEVAKVWMKTFDEL